MSSAPIPPEPVPSPELIEAAAAAWLSLRDRGMSAAETAEFVRWLQQDPRHAAVFSELDRVWKDFDRLGAVVAGSETGPAETDGDLLVPRVRPRRSFALAWSAIGLAAAAIVLVTVTFLHPSRPTAETAVGAFQKLDLPDGSVAQLNTDTAIDVTFSTTERRVRIVRGEVHFAVSHDPARPFLVSAGPVEIRAVGTAFNVRQRDTAIEVLVTEGRVRIEAAADGRSLLAPAESAPTGAIPVLGAGERAIVVAAPRAAAPAPRSALVERVATPAMQRALAWQERRLEFDAVELAEVVREFNRYNRTQMVIADTSLASKRFSGSFRADGYEALVRLLEKDFAVTAIRTGGEIVLRVRR